MTHSPTVRRRRLSKALRRFREEAGLTADEVARALDWAGSKVTRIERNEWRRPSVRDVRDMLRLYGIDDAATIDAMEALAREARQHGWWEEYKDVLGGALPEFEAEASEIHTIQTLIVPGLLQTPEYATAVFRGGQVVDAAGIQRRVAARMSRQRSRDRADQPTFWAVIDEAALRKKVGGVATMQDQLRHLRTMAERPNITIQVLTDDAGAHASMSGPCTILTFRAEDDPALVYIETAAGELFLEQPGDVARYADRCNHVRASALPEERSAAYLDRLIKHIGEETA